VSRSTRDRFVLSDDISIDAVHSDVVVDQTGSAAVSQVGDTTKTVFLEASSVLHEVLHETESDEDGDTDSSMELPLTDGPVPSVLVALFRRQDFFAGGSWVDLSKFGEVSTTVSSSPMYTSSISSAPKYCCLDETFVTSI